MKAIDIRYHYEVFPQPFFHPDIGYYDTFGIFCYWIDENKTCHMQMINDVTLDYRLVWQMADRFNNANLPAIHLHDVIENLI